MTAITQIRSCFGLFIGRVTRHLLRAALLLLLCSNPLAARQNDALAPESVTIKLPYNGPDMQFKAVYLGIDGSNLFASRLLRLGPRDSQNANYKEWAEPVSLAGAFIGKRNGKPDWLYYLGETEVSRGQWNSIMRWLDKQEGKRLLTENSGDPQLPQTGATVAEIYRFIEGLNTWMLQNQKNNLPKLGQSYAFSRLPTEAEWAFAARGGISILKGNPDRFDSPHPYGEDLGKYEWHRVNTNSEIKKCGSKHLLPNPIGLRDMLGNVEEFTISLFSPEYKQGRFGQLVIRGNSSKNSPEEFAVSRRTEFTSHNSTGQLRRPERVGFRLALSSPVSSSARPEKLNEDCKRYMNSDDRYSGSSTAALAEKNSREYCKREADRFRADIVDKNSEISRLQKRHNQDQAALSEKERNILELRERKEELEAQVHDLQKQLIARPTPDVAKALQQKLRQAEAEIQSLTEDLHETQKKLEKFIPIEHDPGSGPLFLTASKKTESGKMRQKIQELQQQIAALPSLKEWEKYQKDLDQLQKQNKNLGLKLSKKNVKERFFIDEGSQKQQKIAELESTLKQKKQRVAVLERRLFDREDKIAENANFAKIAEKRYLDALMRLAYTNALHAYAGLTRRRYTYLDKTSKYYSEENAARAYSQACQYLHDYWKLVQEIAQETKEDLFPQVKQEVSDWLQKGERENLFAEECRTKDGQQRLSKLQRKSLGVIERHVKQVRAGGSRFPDDLIDTFIDQPEFR